MMLRSLFVAIMLASAHALRPINTATRTARDISSNAWVLKLDPADVGIAQNWAMRKLSGQLFDAPVPATLNDIIGADPRATPCKLYAGNIFISKERLLLWLVLQQN